VLGLGFLGWRRDAVQGKVALPLQLDDLGLGDEVALLPDLDLG